MGNKLSKRVGTGNKQDDKILQHRGYTLSKKLGEGSYGKVYLATYKNPRAKNAHPVKLACKLVDGGKAPKNFLRKFFPRELDAMRTVNHPYCIRIHSILQRRLRYFIFMQFAEKGDMLDFIKSRGGLKEDLARIWFTQIIKGMGYMHRMNLCHRDLKCENLLLTAGFTVKISDFGFARRWVPGKDAMSKSFCGTMTYTPPEILRGTPYNPLSADLWSMAVILYVMVNKSLPFETKSMKKMYDNQMCRNWKYRPKVADTLSKDFKRFLYGTLEPIPGKRPKTQDMYNHPWIQNPRNPELKK